MTEPIKGYGIFSGGLDSLLACRLLLDQGIQVVAITFTAPFFDAEKARRHAGQLPMEHRVVDITEPHLDMMEAPRYGFGKALNPCIDCHALMFREAGRIMEAEGGHFLFSGEVLGQRPMSQNRQSLWVVERDSGYPGRVLRPLTAQRLEPTLPEKEGLVDRERLLGITGRGRKPQIALAEKYGLVYPGPAGGCSLTEPNYSRRLRDLREHGAGRDLHQIALLRAGRHIRLSETAKLVVGRNEGENRTLDALIEPRDVVMISGGKPGPTAVLCGTPTPEDLIMASRVLARYLQRRADGTCLVAIYAPVGGALEGWLPADGAPPGGTLVEVEPVDPGWIDPRFV